MDYVIIGNSAAAVGCVEGIRQRDGEGKITLVSKEPFHTYSRPLISYYLSGKTDRERMKYRPDSFYEDNGVTALLGREATAICTEEQRVVLDTGEELPYDRLLIATGSVPFVPEIEGLEGVERKHAFLTLADAEALEREVGKDSSVLILGAGLIGLKCAEGLSARAGSVTVADLADHVLPSILDSEAAAMMERHIAAQGIRFRLSDTVKRFDGNVAVMGSGEKIPFDVLVLAVGVRPNVALAREAGIVVERGIATDEYGRTSAPGVYAAGDCAQSFDVSSGENKVLALLPNAYMQGECAGLHMAGEEKPFGKAIPMNAIGFFGLHIISAGSYQGEEYKQVTDCAYKRLVTKDNLLKGYILLGEVARAGIYTALIRDRVPLDTVDFQLIKDKPQLMAFSRRERSRKLGGVTV